MSIALWIIIIITALLVAAIFAQTRQLGALTELLEKQSENINEQTKQIAKQVSIMSEQFNTTYRPFVKLDTGKNSAAVILPEYSELPSPDAEIKRLQLVIKIKNIGRVPARYKKKAIKFFGQEYSEKDELTIYPMESVAYTTREIRISKMQRKEMKADGEIKLEYWSPQNPAKKYHYTCFFLLRDLGIFFKEEDAD